MKERHVYIVTGQVQGVGFRPFIFREASALGLSGSVGNTPDGVRIEVQGEKDALELFRSFPERLPALARIAALSVDSVPVREEETEFRIELSRQGEHEGHSVLVSPDVAPCPECLRDMADPAGRRFGYPFTNCTNCGPRYTITRSIPYDRPVTSMACFPLCPDCAKEYHDPADRRFHAQPNACPACGPMLWLEGPALPSLRDAYGPLPESPRDNMHEERRTRYGLPPDIVPGQRAVLLLLHALKQGHIAAIRGLGGFHLTCDALNEEAVAGLRLRKRRPHKALAVMVPDLETAACFAVLSEDARRQLSSPQRPIVICPRLIVGPCPLPEILAPDTDSIGLMLPSTPLHYLLFHPEWAGGQPGDALPALVMTSGNPPGAPLCLGNREARERLGDIADLFLCHDRDILVRVDDSVLFPSRPLPPGENAPALMVRRARGFVPSPLAVEGLRDLDRQDSVFAAGAEWKHTFALTRGHEIFLSQHTGDLGKPGCLDFFRETLRHMQGLLEVRPRLVVRDLHPDFPSSLLADAFAGEHGIPELQLQHHVAHICAVMAEHGTAGPVLGLALDGSGLGDDGSIWGGELLLVGPGYWERLGRFSPFDLPGGEAAIRSPWRTAESLWLASGLPDIERPWSVSQAARLPLLDEMLRRRVRCVSTSSCGRLFDAVSALCGACFDITYEGQAAIRLETLQDWNASGSYALPVTERDGLLEADVLSLFRESAGDRNRPGALARRFHRGLVLGLARWAQRAAEKTGVTQVALSGGVFNNHTLRAELPQELLRLGLEPLLPSAYPSGDGAISLGQAFWGSLFLLAGEPEEVIPEEF